MDYSLCNRCARRKCNRELKIIRDENKRMISNKRCYGFLKLRIWKLPMLHLLMEKDANQVHNLLKRHNLRFVEEPKYPGFALIPE